jgi:hypothetical protein
MFSRAAASSQAAFWAGVRVRQVRRSSQSTSGGGGGSQTARISLRVVLGEAEFAAELWGDFVGVGGHIVLRAQSVSVYRGGGASGTLTGDGRGHASGCSSCWIKSTRVLEPRQEEGELYSAIVEIVLKLPLRLLRTPPRFRLPAALEWAAIGRASRWRDKTGGQSCKPVYDSGGHPRLARGSRRDVRGPDGTWNPSLRRTAGRGLIPPARPGSLATWARSTTATTSTSCGGI